VARERSPVDVVRGRETTFRTEDPMASDIQAYGADWCGLTHGVRRYLTVGHVEYDDFDIDDDQAAEEFVIGDCGMTNATVAELRRVLDQQGMRSSRVPR
jgi:hypothetical protein